MEQTVLQRPEILAPAGNADMLRAAVFAGADAVYLGLDGYNARRSAGNFDPDALREAVCFCHARGVAVHVTLNTQRQGSHTAPAAAITKGCGPVRAGKYFEVLPALLCRVPTTGTDGRSG